MWLSGFAVCNNNLQQQTTMSQPPSNGVLMKNVRKYTVIFFDKSYKDDHDKHGKSKGCEMMRCKWFFYYKNILFFIASI